MRKYLSLLLILLLGYLANAQVQDGQKLNKLLDRNENYIEISLDDQQEITEQLEKLDRLVYIDSYKEDDNKVKAYVTSKQLDTFLNSNYEFTVLTPPSMLISKSQLDKQNGKSVNDWDYYPSYPEYVDMMNQFVTDYPDLCELVSIGETNTEHEILFIHISNNLGVDVDEPEFMYTSSMHGDELTGYVLMLRLIDYLLVNYNSNIQVTNLVNNIDIWINPLANPDGTFAGGDNSVYGATRTNANLIDFNRNFPDPEDGPHPDNHEYQVETLAFMDFADEHNFVMSANFHGGAEVINYPWDTWARLAADDDWWQFVSREYADTVHEYAAAGYMTDLDNGITNGYQWYSINGGRQDYMNYFQYCREATMEISSTKLPPAIQLPLFWDYNYRSLLNYMYQVVYGVRGIVTDASEGTPIKAKVFIQGHDLDESFVYSNLPVGNYNRLLKEGSYTLTFSAFGHFDKVIENVSVEDYQSTYLDVTLSPNLGAIETQEINVLVYPNPTSGFLNIELPNNEKYQLKVFTLDGKKILSKSINSGKFSVSLNYPKGDYLITISDDDGNLFTKKIVLK